MKKFFWKDAKGLKADILRHREAAASLVKKISELESIEAPDKMDIAALGVYRQFLCQLQQSKAEVLSKLGK
jgi:hypothetical protein